MLILERLKAGCSKQNTSGVTREAKPIYEAQGHQVGAALRDQHDVFVGEPPAVQQLQHLQVNLEVTDGAHTPPAELAAALQGQHGKWRSGSGNG